MKHCKTGRKFSRERGARKALLKILLGDLIMKEKIKTTEAKAKEVKMLIDPLVNRAKRSQVDVAKKIAVVRELKRRLPAGAVKKVTGDFLKRFSSRNSGYTRVIKMSPRKSDSARMAVIEFV